MKYLSEYRDGRVASKMADRIRAISTKPARFMESCGTHTVAIFKNGVREVLPDHIDLISGPGCPVCVTATRDIDKAIKLARIPDVIVTTFGDMLRVPGSVSSLQKEKGRGADVRMVYSTMDALEIARQNPKRIVVFLGVGFETTAPTVAAAVVAAEAEGMRIIAATETHIHADHITGAGAIRNILNSIVLVHENSRSKCADVLVKDGDFVPLGSEKIHIMHTPGHTDNDLCLLIDGAVFTGDTLLIQGCGRTDFQSGDAATLYRSIHDKFFTLPDETLVYPCHDYEGRCISSIGQEKARNPRLGKNRSLQEFTAIMNGLDLPYPRKIDFAVPGNQECGQCPDNVPEQFRGPCDRHDQG